MKRIAEGCDGLILPPGLVIVRHPVGSQHPRGFMMASVLFSPITLRGLTLPNRVVVSPMCQYNSDNGSANDWHLMHLGSFSLGCAGFVMCEMTNVSPIGRITPKCAGLYSDDNEAALRAFASRVRKLHAEFGDAVSTAEIVHAHVQTASPN